jgi:hypothetical protein
MNKRAKSYQETQSSRKVNANTHLVRHGKSQDGPQQGRRYHEWERGSGYYSSCEHKCIQWAR